MKFSLSFFDKIQDNIYVLKKDHWDYSGIEDFQITCVSHVKENPKDILLIFCNHNHCFTLGRGLQKISTEKNIDLIDFQEDTPLNYPLYKLKRGGGLTFHYPGQIVFYPILNLTHHHVNVYDLMISILRMTKKSLEALFGIEGLEVDTTLLGLWKKSNLENKKVASIGLAVTRFITYHGLALNLFFDENIFNELKNVHPCGLPGNTYSSIEEILLRPISKEEESWILDNLQKLFIEFIQHQSMVDKKLSSFSTNVEF